VQRFRTLLFHIERAGTRKKADMSERGEATPTLAQRYKPEGSRGY
jgi:hypothetical protein